MRIPLFEAIVIAILLIGGGAPVPACGEVVLRERFSESKVDTDRWRAVTKEGTLDQSGQLVFQSHETSSDWGTNYVLGKRQWPRTRDGHCLRVTFDVTYRGAGLLVGLATEEDYGSWREYLAYGFIELPSAPWNAIYMVRDGQNDIFTQEFPLGRRTFRITLGPQGGALWEYCHSTDWFIARDTTESRNGQGGDTFHLVTEFFNPPSTGRSEDRIMEMFETTGHPTQEKDAVLKLHEVVVEYIDPSVLELVHRDWDARKRYELESPMKVEPVQAGRADDAPIYGFGRIFVHGVSPIFQDNPVLQIDNNRPFKKIEPEKSFENEDTPVGGFPIVMPRSPEAEEQPFLSINLIDGNPYTFWACRNQPVPDFEPAWIRLDLAKEETIRQIRIVPAGNRRGIPRKLTVRISRDSRHWVTVYEEQNLPFPAIAEDMVIDLAEPKIAKQVWIIGENLRLASPYELIPTHCSFSAAEIQVINEAGNNVALHERGTGVTVSSTNYTYHSQWELVDAIWATHVDLGFNWIRLSGWGGPLMWETVEPINGQYSIDPRADEAISEFVDNGMEIVMILGYWNSLYTRGIRPLNRRAFPYGPLPHPPNEEVFEGFKNYCRFMARHFKGRVAYYEIWNEPPHWGWEETPDWLRKYCKLIKECAVIIKQEDPGAGVAFGGLSPVANDFEKVGYGGLELGMAEHVDMFSWHTQQGELWNPESEAYRNFPQTVRNFQKAAREKGFDGEFMSTENWWGARYPSMGDWGVPNRFTEITKAKEMARMYLIQIGLDVIPFWCNTWADQMMPDASLFRNTFSADPMVPQQPQAAYYVLRTICTVMDQTTPNETLELDFSNEDESFEVYCFDRPGGEKYIAIWLTGETRDMHPGVETDVVVKDTRASEVKAIDLLNGIEQELECEFQGDNVYVPGVLVKDYPVILSIQTGS